MTSSLHLLKVFVGILGLLKFYLHTTFLKLLEVMHSTSHLHDIFSFFEINLQIVALMHLDCPSEY